MCSSISREIEEFFYRHPKVQGAQVVAQPGGQLLAGLQRLLVGLGACGDARNQHAEVVANAEKNDDEFRVDTQLVAAHPIENAFGDVGEFHHMVEAEQAGRPLDGVRGAMMRMRASSRTNSKAPSMVSLSALVRKLISKPR